jgi:hypothetical protein
LACSDWLYEAYTDYVKPSGLGSHAGIRYEWFCEAAIQRRESPFLFLVMVILVFPFPPISSFPSHPLVASFYISNAQASMHAAPSPPPPHLPTPLYPTTVRRIHQSSCARPVPPLPNPRWGARVLPLGGARIVQGVRVWALVPLGAAGAAPFRTGPVPVRPCGTHPQVPSSRGPHP